MTTISTLDQARQAYSRQDWQAAFDLLSAAHDQTPLNLDDLERLIAAAHMSGHDEQRSSTGEHAYHEAIRQGDVPRAARFAFLLAFPLMLAGETARATGWLNRARRALDEHRLETVERGYLEIPQAVRLLHEGDFATGRRMCEEITRLARKFNDEQLRIMSELGVAQSMIRTGNLAEGFALLDELMVSAASDVLSPMIAGLLYCAAIECCQATFDLRRAQEWTEGLERWCDSQQGLVPFHRECLVHRSEILQLHGAWPDAMLEARRAGDLGPQATSGAAYYQQAEILRLQGEFAKAEEAYRLSSRNGHAAQPGLALLRLAQGQVETAAAAIRLVLSQTLGPAERSRALPAFIEIMLDAGDVDAAEDGARELTSLATTLGAPLLFAASHYANGATLLRRNDAAAAIRELRAAFAGWQAIEAPYEAARARVLAGVACQKLGDHDTAAMELDAARWLFQKLGAAPDLARVEALSPRAASAGAGGLTDREIEVLRLVASGKTNRAIAADHVVSENTVRRHLQNIFAKAGVSSRAAATAFAFQHGLA
jgi:DNA-binding CsgD family transcriptional regulator